MTPVSTLERVAEMRNAVNRKPRISMTDMARDTSWKKTLPEQGIIEVTERGETAAWLVSDENMTALMEELAELEVAVEYYEVQHIIGQREGEFRPLSGDELARALEAEWAQWGETRWESSHGNR